MRSGRERHLTGSGRSSRKRLAEIFILLSVWILAGLLASSGEAQEAELRGADLRDQLNLLKQLWGSIDTLEIQCDEFPLDSLGSPDLSRGFIRNEFRHKKENRWAHNVSSVKIDGKVVPLITTLANGQRRFNLSYFPGISGEISNAHIKNQDSTPELYRDAKFSALWLIIPGGKPLHTYLEEGGTLVKAKDFGPSCWTLEAKDRGMTLKCVLDDDRDWLPRRVELGQGSDFRYWEATKFLRDNNRWYPAEGRFTATAPKGTVLKGFQISRAAINRPIDLSLFELPTLPDGVRVSDDILETATLRGGLDAWKRRQQKYGHRPEPAVQAKQRVEAFLTPNRFPWPVFIAVISVVMLLIAGVSWFRRRNA